MRTTLSVMAVTAAALLAVPQTAQAAPPHRDQVTGTGYLANFHETVTVDVTRLGQSGKVRGTATVDYDEGYGTDYSFEVTCLYISGNRVSVSGPHGTIPNEYHGIVIDDNGETGDKVTTLWSSSVDCTEPFRESFYTLDSGNFIVVTGNAPGQGRP